MSEALSARPAGSSSRSFASVVKFLDRVNVGFAVLIPTAGELEVVLRGRYSVTLLGPL